MTPAARATALLVAVVVGIVVLAAATLAAFRGVLAVLEHRDEHRDVHRDEHPAAAPRHVRRARSRPVEAATWAVSQMVAFFREDRGPKAAVTFAFLFLAFSVLIGASQ